jgi:hypothetical protein
MLNLRASGAHQQNIIGESQVLEKPVPDLDAIPFLLPSGGQPPENYFQHRIEDSRAK